MVDVARRTSVSWARARACWVIYSVDKAGMDGIVDKMPSRC
jgi:hypothetical protein